MNRQQKRTMKRKLKRLQKDVRPAWILDIGRPMTQDELMKIVAARPLRIIAQAYAVAILEHGLSGRIQWEEVGRAVRARFRWIPSVVEVTKVRAWKAIKKAKGRQGAARTRSRRGPSPSTSRIRDRLSAVLGPVTCYLIAIGLVLAGVATIAALVGYIWGIFD